jgi:hypothetical protein
MRVIINSKVKEFIDYWVAKCPYEIAGMGVATILDNGTIRVDNVELLQQTVTGASVDMDADSINKLAWDKRLEGNIRFHFHSHVDMSVFFSSTDKTAYEDYVKNGGWLLAGVFNKKGESKFIYYQGISKRDIDPFPPIVTEDIVVSYTSGLSEEESLWAEAQYTDKVKIHKFEHTGSLLTYEDYELGGENLTRVSGGLEDLATRRDNMAMPNPNNSNFDRVDDFKEIVREVMEDYSLDRKEVLAIYNWFLQDYKEKPKNYRALTDYIDLLSIGPANSKDLYEQ